MTSASILKTAAAQVAGRWTDERLSGAQIALEGWTSTDSTIHCLPTGVNATESIRAKGRTKEKEARFRKELIKAQGAAGVGDDSYLLWCPISHAYLSSRLIKAAHIVDVNVGEKTVQALFGDEEEHIWSANNGIIMDGTYEALLDNGMAAILPASNAPDEKEFQFVLLEKDMSRYRDRAAVWGKALDGQRLVFKTDWRPPKTYLYFKFAISLLRRRRGQVPGYLEDLPNLADVGKALWASPGPYLKRSILYKFARNVGCLTTEQANRFWDVDSAPMEKLTAELESLSTSYSLQLSREVARKSNKSTRDEEEEEEEEDDDDDDDDSDDEGDIFD